MNEPLFGYDSAEQKQSPEQGIHSQCTNGFHVSHQVHLQNSRLYSYLLYAKLLCKCRIDFIRRIYLSCFDGINTFLEFCIKLFSGHCTNSTNGNAYRFLFGGSNSGKAVNERSAMQMTAVYACVRILSESIAGLVILI